MLDGFKGFRSRFDQIQLVQEVLDEIPCKLGLQPAMPAFILPYYNGVVSEDCGISSFVFLMGGHFTIHTFSFRETYFVDLVSCVNYDQEKLIQLLNIAFPCAQFNSQYTVRSEKSVGDIPADLNVDFGPHLMIEVENYNGPESMDELFTVFDSLPSLIGMTPIMRPYIIRGENSEGETITSIMTMIAESHISLHLFHDRKKVFFDLFSCSFFEKDIVIANIKKALNIKCTDSVQERIIVRGVKYKKFRSERIHNVYQLKTWLNCINP